MNASKLILSSVSALVLIPSAHAAILANDVIGVDFGGTIAGNNWNHVGVGGDASTLGLDHDEQAPVSNPFSITIADLGRLSDGNATGVGFSISNSTGQIAWDFSNASTQGDGGLITSAGADVHGDGLISNDASGRTTVSGVDYFLVTFTGLDDSLTYNFVGGWDHNNANFDTTWEAYTDNTFGTVIGGQTFTTDVTGADGEGYGSLTGLSSSGGELYLGLTGDGGTAQIVVGALTLTAVPEPSSTLLVGAGGFLMLLRRNRRS